jgi:hypothetical protein
MRKHIKSNVGLQPSISESSLAPAKSVLPHLSVLFLRALLAWLPVATPMAAQRTTHLGIAVGPTFPTGTFADEVNTGGQLTSFVDFPLPVVPAGFRVELAYVRLGSTHTGQQPFMVPFLLGLSCELPIHGRLRPYIVAGTGAYYFKSKSPTFDDNKLGLNGGCGIVWRHLYLEGRFHYVFDRGDSYFPIVIGVRF